MGGAEGKPWLWARPRVPSCTFIMWGTLPSSPGREAGCFPFSDEKTEVQRGQVPGLEPTTTLAVLGREPRALRALSFLCASVTRIPELGGSFSE